MSSLQSIMNLDDDQQDAASPMDKRVKDSTPPASGFRHHQPIHPSQQHSTQLTYLHQDPPHPASTSAVQQGKRPTDYADSRRQSSTSADSMEPHGYGSAASSSSVGGGTGSGGYSPNVPRRPMGTSPGPEVPVRLTPITGRVSRAKKGVPVHVCDQCNPPKTFTRAEHLRRHQLGHQKPQYPCTYPDCTRAFYRQDLLTRHELRHTQEGGDPSSPRLSDTGAGPEEQTSVMGATNPYSAATGSMSNTRPSTPPGGSSTRSAMSPRHAEGHDRPSSGHHSSGYPSYAMHSGYPIINQPTGSLSPSPEPPTFSAVPRRSPISLYNIAQSLSPSTSLGPPVDPPELDSSWTSEDGYSTPSEMSRHQPQAPLNWSTTSSTLLPAGFPAQDGHELSVGGGVDIMAPPYYLTTPFSVSPHHSYGPLLNEPLMANFTEEQIQLLDPSITGHHGIHQGQPSVRSSSPSLSISVSGQAADTLVTPAPLHRIEPMARVSRQKELVVGGSAPDLTANIANWTGGSPGGLHGGGGGGLGRGPALARPTGAILNAVPSYIEIYWKHAHRALPIVHRPLFEVAGEEALRYAMAALATQHLNSMEDRIRGSQLHEYAWQEAKRCAPGNIQGMQAIFLCEHFSRFRGRRPLVRPSKAFESLYSRVVDHGLGSLDYATSATGFEHQPQKPHLAATKEQHWRSWLESEAYRRLLAACFCLDHHAATYHQQPRAKDPVDVSNIPLTGPSDALWEADSVDEWHALLEAEPTAATPKYLPSLDTLGPDDVAGFSKLDQGSLLCAQFLELENHRRASSPNNKDASTPTAASYTAELVKADKYERAATLFSKSMVAPIANAYAALHHTPLHDLLAVSGDSWVFSQKVLDPPTFLEHQKRLKAWAEGRTSSVSPTSTTMQPTSPGAAGLEGLSSAKATIYAARTLASLLDGLYCQRPRLYVGCISTYWAIYVSALIIWAYGQYRGGSKASGGSGGSPSKGAPMTKEETVNWLRAVAAMGQPEHLARVRGRREASAGVVSMVNEMLAADCVGGRSRLYVDATVVLRKLEDGVNVRYF